MRTPHLTHVWCLAHLCRRFTPYFQPNRQAQSAVLAMHAKAERRKGLLPVGLRVQLFMRIRVFMVEGLVMQRLSAALRPSMEDEKCSNLP